MSAPGKSASGAKSEDGAPAADDATAPRGTAHGKVILFGEHAVVYGVPALAVGIDRGAWAQASAGAGAGANAGAGAIASAAGKGGSVLHVRGWDVTVREDGGEDGPALGRAFRDVLAATRREQRAAGGAEIGDVRVEAEADLPPGGGLGCSAALGVAVARALDPGASAESIAARVDAWERVFHGNPSGIDAAVAAMGGCVQFTRGDGGAGATIERVRVSEDIHLCIGHTGQASSTKSMVESVARIRERRPEITQKTFDAIHTLVKNARLAIVDHDLRAIGQLPVLLVGQVPEGDRAGGIEVRPVDRIRVVVPFAHHVGAVHRLRPQLEGQHEVRLQVEQEVRQDRVVVDVARVLVGDARQARHGALAVHRQRLHAGPQVHAPAQVGRLRRLVVAAHVVRMLVEQRMRDRAVQALGVVLEDQLPVALQVVDLALDELEVGHAPARELRVHAGQVLRERDRVLRQVDEDMAVPDRGGHR